MLSRNQKITAVLIITLLATGCTQPSEEGDSDNFIQVNQFEAIPNPVPAEEDIRLNMEIENTGDARIEKAASRIFGPAFINDISESERTKEFGSLQPESDTSFPKRQSWTISGSRLPPLSRNREATYNIYSKIFYDYETRANPNIKLVSRERFREQEYSTGEANIDNSEGPISLGIRGNTPIKFSDGSIDRQIYVTVENAASGQAFIGGKVDGGEEYEPDAESAKKDTVELVIKRIQGVNIDLCPNSDENNQAGTGEEVRVEVNLVEGNSGWQCFNIKNNNLVEDETDVNMLITAEYNYVEEESTSVTVEGRR